MSMTAEERKQRNAERKALREYNSMIEQQRLEEERRRQEEEFRDSLPIRFLNILRFVDKNGDKFFVNFLDHDVFGFELREVEFEDTTVFSLDMPFRDSWLVTDFESRMETYYKKQREMREREAKRDEILSRMSKEEREILGV